MAGILTHEISDHLPCIVHLSFSFKKQKQSLEIKTRELDCKKIAKIKENLLKTKWSELKELKSDNLDLAFNHFHDRVLLEIHSIAPEKTNKKRTKNEESKNHG